MPIDLLDRYVPQGSTYPSQYPLVLYGTEVIELNIALPDRAMKSAKNARSANTATTQAFRSNFASTAAFKAGLEPPSILACGVTIGDQVFEGKFQSDAFENTPTLFTNGTCICCTSAQEDAAALESPLRLAEWLTSGA